MSFSSETKVSAVNMPKTKSECRAMLYGMLLFSTSFSENEIVYMTENAEVSDIVSGLLLGVFDIMETPDIKTRGSSCIFTIKISDNKEVELINKEYASVGFTNIDKSIFSGINDEIAFLRGAFLSCGYINPPDKPYRLDFTVKNPDLAVDLALVLCEHLSSMPKLSVRKSSQVVYYRDSNVIVDFLNLLGLNNAAFSILNSQIERDIRNNLNRRNNFDFANIAKKTDASIIQIDAINYLMECGEFEKLPAALRITGKIRIQNPEASLDALGKLENPPISKSQVSKRLHKIVEHYKKIQGGTDVLPSSSS